jgi:hypothetical protein
MWRARSSALALLALSLTGNCKRVEEPHANERALPSSRSDASATSAIPAPIAARLVAPTELLTLPSSAYQALLFVDDEAIELLTSTAAHRVLPGKAPLTRAINLGFAATVTRKHYVYWSQGTLYREPRSAPDPARATKLAALREPPQRIVADISGEDFAFLMHSDGARDALAVLDHQRLKTLYTSPGSIDALTMIGDALYFVERPNRAGFRLGRVKLAGGEALYSSTKTGRWPALLQGVDELVYYDGARRDVLGVSLDLQHQRTLAEDFICSPLAVRAHVYCSTMAGIFELSATAKPRQLVPAPHELITNLAVNSERLAFITDIGAQGQDRLALYAVPLGAPSTDAAPP